MFRSTKDVELLTAAIGLLLIAGIFGHILTASAEPEGVPTPAPVLRIEPNGLIRSGIAYEVLTYDVVNSGRGERKNNWHPNANQSEEWRATPADYEGSGFDKGHEAPADDYGHQSDIDATFDMANCAPQEKHFNRGLWLQVEAVVREAVKRDATLHVVTLPLYLPDDDGIITIKTIGKHRVWVPTHYAKALLKEENGKRTMVAWKIPNKLPPDGASIWDYKASVDEIEFDAGVDLFSWLPEDVQKRLESAK